MPSDLLPPNWPAMTIAQANAALAGPGSPVEVTEAEIGGVKQKVYANAPPNIHSILFLAAAQFPDRDYIVYQDERVTYTAMLRAVEHFAAVLRDRYGIRKGDRVGIIMRNYPQWPVAFYAALSLGAIATPMYAGLVGDDLPDARLTVLADGSGAYPDVPAVNASIGARWGTEAAIPDWPVNDGLTAADWSFPDLFVQAGRHRPDIVFARHDYAYDRVQTLFAALAGLGVADLLTSIDANEASIEAAGVPLASYVSPGADHTVLSSRRFYDEATGGVPLVDWVTDLVAGDPVDDVRCEVCTGS